MADTLIMVTNRPTKIEQVAPRAGSIPAPSLVATSYEAYVAIILARAS